MRHAIIEKLRKHLESGLKEEADAVYLFIEIGKYIEQTAGSNYPIIRFYRNWVAHSRIERFGLAGDIPIRLEELISKIILEQHLSTFEKTMKEISNLVAFRHLFEELRRFFQENSLRKDLLEDRVRWTKFGKLLVGILADVPLIFSPKIFKYIKTFSFKEVRLRGNIKDSIATWYIEAKGNRFQGPVLFRTEEHE